MNTILLTFFAVCLYTGCLLLAWSQQQRRKQVPAGLVCALLRDGPSFGIVL